MKRKLSRFSVLLSMLVILTVAMAACGGAMQDYTPTAEPFVQQQPEQQPATNNAPDAGVYDELMEMTGFNFSIAIATINTHLSAIAQIKVSILLCGT